MEELYRSLKRRLRPEDVAELVLDRLATKLSREEFVVLEKAAAGSLRRSVSHLTSMSQEFFSAIPPQRQVIKAQELFATARALSSADCANVDRLLVFAQQLSAEIGKAVGASSYKHDRLNRAGRRLQGLQISRRRYDKLFRFLRRFERKIETYRMQLRRDDAQHVAKHGLASRIALTDFLVSEDAACFIAYFVARRNRRSVFTNVGQDQAFDEVCAVLLARFRRHSIEAGWRAIAYVMPDSDVMVHLSDQSKMDVFAAWLAELRKLAVLMREVWDRSHFNRASMIVSRGDDSSTWNAVAGAWNAARQGWLAAVHALGMGDVLDLVCLGKAMRLMAADVAAWHRASGGGLDPDTAVWAALPAPWEVLSGSVTCTRAEVEAICEKVGVDPTAKGWTAPRDKRVAVSFQPTPELVHGVTVNHPELAAMLRKAGWFSGKAVKPSPGDRAVVVQRDHIGMALSASEDTTEARGRMWQRLSSLWSKWRA